MGESAEGNSHRRLARLSRDQHSSVSARRRGRGRRVHRLRRARVHCLAILFVTSCVAATMAAARPGPLTPPQVALGDLYATVEDAGIFPDSKTFADAIPTASPAAILRLFREEHPAGREALRRFVRAHFIMPTEPGPPIASVAVSNLPPIAQHIDRLWLHLVRRSPSAPRYSSLIALPYPYVVPGGRFREMYYWDSYFTMLGLAESGRQDLVRDMVADFAHLIDAYGHIPNGNRTYYLSRSQPPFFFEMVGLLNLHNPAKAYARYLPELKAEYRFWMRGADGLRAGQARDRVVALPDGAVLNRYWDNADMPRDESFREDRALAEQSPRPAAQTYRDVRAAAESGWDFSSRWFSDAQSLPSIDTTEVIPVDLNSLLFGLENAIRLGCGQRKDDGCVREFARRSAKRRAAMNRYLWAPTRGAYLDYRWTQKTSSNVLSAATLYPLFVGLADKVQATAVASITQLELLKPGGLVTTTAVTGQQWDAPNGWAPLQWVAVAGLRRYDKTLPAQEIACRWIVNVHDVYRRTGKLVEKYDVVTLDRPGGGGEYPLQDGFGWTNGVTRQLLALYPFAASYRSVDQCPKTGGTHE
ncbi:MAG: alpha,alpha-trehalase TreA [Alphaproteobacteria bacterium]|nr:alpha,alpha-trehalase TreA [Alphaproteobacteria bacterium]MDE2493499.1 alpha,alpha-trehalase TreA [Alphaproteobacteria bacterium]